VKKQPVSPKYVPSRDRVLVSRIEERISEVIEEDVRYKQKSCKAEVLFVGKDYAEDYFPGDVIFIGEHNGEELDLDGFKCTSVYGSDIRLKIGQ